MMLTQQQAQQIQTQKNYGKIYPLKFSLYSNPQMCMFTFTLLLTIFISMVMILNVFMGLYHKIIGSLLCFYCTYRFISLGLSNPGLAVQTYDQLLTKYNHQMNVKEQFIHKQNNQIAQNLPCQKNKTAQQSNQKVSNNSQLFQDNQRILFPFQSRIKNLPLRQFHNFCDICKVPTRRRTKHCTLCKTCIDGHDHHCIWIGKCIGKKNMWQFKDFLCFVFVTLIYSLVLSLKNAKIQPESK